MARLESLYSAQVSAMASDTLYPSQVTGLLHVTEQGKVILNWNAVTTNNDASSITDLAGYRVYRKKTEGEEFAKIGTVAADVVTYTDETIKDGTSYIYAVSAFDDEAEPQEGLKSDALAVKTIPSVPTGLVASAVDGLITLEWTSVKDAEDAELNETLAGYSVYRSTVDGSGYESIGSVAGDVEKFEDSSVENDTTYYYVITAYDNSL